MKNLTHTKTNTAILKRASECQSTTTLGATEIVQPAGASARRRSNDDALVRIAGAGD